jgi:hypothetical protein
MRLLKHLLPLLLFVGFNARGQVNLQTGAATYSMPIFSYSNEDRLSTTISLDYLDGSGLKVNEVAGSVGTGWNLKFGGVITRKQRGLPDDQKRDLLYQNPLPENSLMSIKDYRGKLFANGYLFSVYNNDLINTQITNEGGWQKVLPSSYYTSGIGFYQWPKPRPVSEFIEADREMDIFKLDFGKGEFEFVIGKDFSIRLLNDSKLKVEVVTERMLESNIKTCISKFIVTDIDGIQYIFSTKELSEELLYDNFRTPTGSPEGYIDLNENLIHYPEHEGVLGGFPTLFWIMPSVIHYGINNNVITNYPVYTARKTGNFIVTKWYLSQILNPLVGSNNQINFNYENYLINMNTSKIMSRSNIANEEIINKEIIFAKRIKNINSGDTKVEFIYEAVPRIDVPEILPLKEIQIKKQNSTINKYVFEYQYFLASLIKPYNYQFDEKEKFMTRLCLKSIQKLDVDNLSNGKPTSFEYYTGNPNNYQGFSTNSHIYVGSRDIVPPMFSFNTDHYGYYQAVTGVYDEMPTNYVIPNRAVIECSSCDWKNPVSGGAKNGILKSINSPLGGKLSYEYEQNQVSYNGENIDVGGVRVSKVNQYDGISHANDLDIEYKYCTSNGINSSGWGYEIPIYSQTKSSRVYIQTNQPGLSVSSIGNSLASSTITSGLVGLAANTGLSASQSFISGAISGLINGIIGIVINFMISLFTQNNPPEFIETTKIIYQSNSLQSKNPLPHFYSRVEVYEKQNNISLNGKKIYDFTSNIDYPINFPNYLPPYTNEQRCKMICYGLPKKITVYDKNGFLLKETTNDYEESIPVSVGKSLEWITTKNIADVQPSSHSAYLNSVDNIIQKIYNIWSYNIFLIKTTEKIYTKNSMNFLETKTDYTYVPNSHLQRSVITTDSRGAITESKMFYSPDYNTPMATALVSKNIITPLSTETWLTKPYSTPELLSTSVTEYGIAANGDYKPVKLYNLETDVPVAESTIGEFNPSLPVRNANLIKQNAEITYDTKGNVSEQIAKPSNRIATTMYDIDNMPVASISNTNRANVAYSSFETRDVFNAGIQAIKGDIIPDDWDVLTIGDDPIQRFYHVGTCPTGNRCISLQWEDDKIQTTIPITKESILSFWAKGNVIKINNVPIRISAAIAKSEPINGWVYYEILLPAGAAQQVITGKNVLIDEVRLYPSNAKMVTSNYDLANNKINECDINNRITYYESDKLGRPLKVMDEKRNVIKTYEYNFKN